IGYTYGQQAYKPLTKYNIECQTVISSHHVTFDEARAILAHDLAPWNVPTVEGQWEGLLLRQHKPEHQNSKEEDSKFQTLDSYRIVAVDNVPLENLLDALEAQQPLSPTIDDLTNCFKKLHMVPCSCSCSDSHPTLTSISRKTCSSPKCSWSPQKQPATQTNWLGLGLLMGCG
ncbi:hypothetical protein PAXRUDRAFT_132079, partial [Paxillus rubicundulus Ve08.2h10]